MHYTYKRFNAIIKYLQRYLTEHSVSYDRTIISSGLKLTRRNYNVQQYFLKVGEFNRKEFGEFEM